jgi:alkyl hydroperoxide reductase subunit AhpC
MQVGDKAPDFTAQAWVDGAVKDDFSLSAVNKDKIVVLAFYPLDFTGG